MLFAASGARGLYTSGPLQRQFRDAHAINAHIAFNTTIKSAFDMALHDLAARAEGVPLYRFLGGSRRPIETDMTLGIGTPEKMAEAARSAVAKGACTLKVKLGKAPPGAAGVWATMAGGGVRARAWCPVMRPAPVAPTAPAATRARMRRRGVEVSVVVFMVWCLSNRSCDGGQCGHQHLDET